eukprot:TRINITY_DN74286_c0_g1_i1.p1 TRINITY_DN74286_c0_g1~~TRINITY_DN74286_c0_g1_i1.p1  ORF type:complete len:432 (-),score=72.59 TRINITY_DN74286_c0_g1_i1:126-1331(-)
MTEAAVGTGTGGVHGHRWDNVDAAVLFGASLPEGSMTMGTASASHPPVGIAKDEEARAAFVADWQDEAHRLLASSADYYFNSYGHYAVHEDVLKDHVTSTAFIQAIRQNAHLFRGAVVLDVCAGLGFCSLLAAEAGAKRVIALESQKELVLAGERIARRNGFGPEVVEFVCASVASIDKLPGDIETVDIIVSEWMGYFMMYEGRLAEVIQARDRWLRKDGLLFPDRARLHLAFVEDADYKTKHHDYFGKVWSFDFSPMKQCSFESPVVKAFDVTQVLTTSACVLDLDLRTCIVPDCYNLASAYQVACTRPGQVYAAMFWFEVIFSACHTAVSFTTDAESEPTCWKQTAFYLQGAPLDIRAGDVVRGMVAVRRIVEEKRSLDIKFSFRMPAHRPSVQFFRWM